MLISSSECWSCVWQKAVFCFGDDNANAVISIEFGIDTVEVRRTVVLDFIPRQSGTKDK